MAPPKAPAGSGPKTAVAKGKTKNPSLTPRELHQIVLRVLSLSALAEGPTVPAGSRTERWLLDVFRRIDRLLEHAERRVPLADVLDGKGNTVGAFTLSDFDHVELQRALRSICKEQKKLFDTAKFKTKTFSRAIEVAFARADLPISAESADEDVELVTTIYRSSSPTSMTDVILGRHGLSKTRMIQYRLPSLPEAKRRRGHLRKPSISADLVVVQEFLTCLQVHPAEVRTLASTILLRRMRGTAWHGDYTLREAAPPLSAGSLPASESSK